MSARQLDPQARVLLERAARSGYPLLHTVSAAEARRLYRDMRVPLQPPPPEVQLASGLRFPGPAGPVAARLYRGLLAPQSAPVIVYFHGGGWTYGDLDTHDVPCRTLANFARCAVLSVDYRLGPENKFPAAFEDCLAAVRWVAGQGGALGLDTARIAVAGDSAGGNLAAAAALAMRDEGLRLAQQVLVYPALDMRACASSHLEFASGYLLEREGILWCRANYLRDEADALDWRASPLLASDLAGLAPAYVVTAGFDPLRDEGAAYAERLEASGVSVTYECFEGMVHGFITMGAVLAAANHALYRIGHALRIAFSRAGLA